MKALSIKLIFIVSFITLVVADIIDYLLLPEFSTDYRLMIVLLMGLTLSIAFTAIIRVVSLQNITPILFITMQVLVILVVFLIIKLFCSINHSAINFKGFDLIYYPGIFNVILLLSYILNRRFKFGSVTLLTFMLVITLIDVTYTLLLQLPYIFSFNSYSVIYELAYTLLFTATLVILIVLIFFPKTVKKIREIKKNTLMMFFIE